MRKDKRKNANINDDAERDKIGLAELSVIKKKRLQGHCILHISFIFCIFIHIEL